MIEAIRRLRRGSAGQALDNLRGIGLMVFSTACQALMYVSIREVPGGMHPFEVAFFRNFFAVLLLALWFRRDLGRRFRTEHLRLHVVRGVLNVTAMLCFFYAVLITPLADVAALGFTAPLFATLLAAVVLRERLRAHRLAVMAIGFAGAIVILRPGLASAYLGPSLLLSSSAIWAVTMLVIKVLARTDSPATITLYMGTVMAPISLVAAAFFWSWPDAHQVAWLVLIALLGTLGQVALVQAFRLAEVSSVVPLDFLKLIWSALLGYAVFAEAPDVFTWLGGTTIFASTTYLALRESRGPRTPAAPTLAAAPVPPAAGGEAAPR